jgi:hypothetical protein
VDDETASRFALTVREMMRRRGVMPAAQEADEENEEAPPQRTGTSSHQPAPQVNTGGEPATGGPHDLLAQVRRALED